MRVFIFSVIILLAICVLVSANSYFISFCTDRIIAEIKELPAEPFDDSADRPMRLWHSYRELILLSAGASLADKIEIAFIQLELARDPDDYRAARCILIYYLTELKTAAAPILEAII